MWIRYKGKFFLTIKIWYSTSKIHCWKLQHTMVQILNPSSLVALEKFTLDDRYPLLELWNPVHKPEKTWSKWLELSNRLHKCWRRPKETNRSTSPGSLQHSNPAAPHQWTAWRNKLPRNGYESSYATGRTMDQDGIVVVEIVGEYILRKMSWLASNIDSGPLKLDC